RGEWQRAMGDFNRAIELKPNLARHYVLRGEGYAALRDYEHALADFEHAIRLEPGNNPFAYHMRGAIFRRNGNFDGAISAHDQGLRTSPADVFGLASRAYALSEKGDNDRALADTEQALRVAPNSAYAF